MCLYQKPDQSWLRGVAEEAHDRTTWGITHDRATGGTVPNLCVLNLQREKGVGGNKINVKNPCELSLQSFSKPRGFKWASAALSPHCSCVDGLFLAGLFEISQLCSTSLLKPVIETGSPSVSLTLCTEPRVSSLKGSLGHLLSWGPSSQEHTEGIWGLHHLPPAI